MCIAAVIFSPVSLEYLSEMHKDNPHGGGVAFASVDKHGVPGIRFIKGLNAKQVFKLQEDKVLTYPYLLHFRWATMGDKVAALCHPFPIGPRALLGETKGFAPRVMIHNGTWGGYTRRIPLNSELPDSLLKCQSDTALAAWLMQDIPDLLAEIAWATAVGWVNENGEMDIETNGTWTDHEGNWYSNLSWLPAKQWWDASNKRVELSYARMVQSASGKAEYSRKAIERPGWDDPDWEKKWMDWYMGTHNRDGTLKEPELEHCAEVTLEQLGMSREGLEGSDIERALEECDITPQEEKESIMRSNEFGTWDDYIRAKYGDEVAEACAELSPEMEDVEAPDSYEDMADMADMADMVSDDPATVNAALAKMMA